MPANLRCQYRQKALAASRKKLGPEAIRGSVAVVILAVLILAVLASEGCSSKGASARSIEAAMRQDRDFHRQVAGEIGVVEKYWSPSKTVQRYVEALRAIDMSACPQDFQQAYLRHIQAWERLRIERANNEGLGAFLKGYFGGGASLLRSMEADEGVQKEVAETWFEVERIALGYGASIATPAP